ncbi:hypothetical protein MASR2M36_15790 [Providencia sp.]
MPVAPQNTHKPVFSPVSDLSLLLGFIASMAFVDKGFAGNFWLISVTLFSTEYKIIKDF